MMKLDHIQLAMPPGGEPQARAYFVNILGMQEQAKPYPLSERGGCWFQKGDVIVHLGVESEFAPQRKAHPAFVVDALDDLAASLAQAGYLVKWDEALPDRRRFYSTDPYENRIEFIADGDGFLQRPEIA